MGFESLFLGKNGIAWEGMGIQGNISGFLWINANTNLVFHSLRVVA